MPCEAFEEFGVFGHAAHVSLKKREAFLDRGELPKELFLGEILFRESASAFVVIVDDTFHDAAPSIGLRRRLHNSDCERHIDEHRCQANHVVLCQARRSEAVTRLQPPLHPAGIAITRRPKPG